MIIYMDSDCSHELFLLENGIPVVTAPSTIDLTFEEPVTITVTASDADG